MVRNILVTFTACLLLVAIDAKAIEPLRKRVLGETSVQEPTWFCIHRLKAEKTWKTLKTPGYPKSLDVKHSRCTWKITAKGKLNIRIAFRGVGLAAEDPEHCSSNYLEIIDEILGKSQVRVCGRKTAGDIVSQGNKLRMDLQRDPSSTNQRGFSISYMATKAKPGFYAKKTFNDKPLPPMKRPKPESKDGETKKNKKPKGETKKPELVEDPKTGMTYISSDGQLIQGHPKKRQTNTRNSGFKPLSESEGETSGMSTLAIVGIVVGAVIGIVIIILIFRKLFLNSKDKQTKDEPVQMNSGMPKVNMSHENVVSAKRNILAPTVVVNGGAHNNYLPPVQENPRRDSSKWSSSDSGDSGHPPDPRIANNSNVNRSKAVDRSNSHKHKYDNGITNRAYEDDVPPRAVPHNVPSSPGRNTGSSRRKSPNESLQKQTPYRYNSNKKYNFDHKKAIEALNNEKFEYGTVPPAHQHSIPRNGKQSRNSQTRRSARERNIPDAGSSDSYDSDVFPPESPNKRGKSPGPHFRDVQRQKELPTQFDMGQQDRLRGGVSRTWNNRERSDKGGMPTKRRSTVGESANHTNGRKTPKMIEQKSNVERRSKALNRKDYKIDWPIKTRDHSEGLPPSPNLPRHVVPSSRR